LNKRVLIIGYFYVDTNMGGVRQRRIARLLPGRGWEPVVLTHPYDDTSVRSNDPGVRLEHVAAPDLTQIYARLRGRNTATPGGKPEPKAKEIGLTGMLNRWVMIPDKQIPWYRAAVRRGRELLQREKFDAIFASIEPRTSALVAARLAEETGVRCVIEYRDLWTNNPYHHIGQPTALHRWLHSRCERRVLKQADAVSAVCRGIAIHLSKSYPDLLRSPVELNYNFFDPGEYPPTDEKPRPFTISYTGAMYASRTPHQFFEGMRAFIDRGRLTPEQFRFRWAGGAAGIKDLGEVLDRHGIRPYLDFLGQIPHREALRLLRESDAALLQSPEDAIHIPGKLFEALGARVPLLALAHPCEVTQIIERCHAGIICPYTTASVMAALEEFHRLSQQKTRWSFVEAEVERYSADAAAGRLAALFEPRKS
jgi:glycosyltransferase involved in cell wall biosynthesis